MALWANLHGGFVFGLVLVAPIALDAVVGAEARARKTLILRWAAFGAALIASFCTPYGWNALLASRKILELGSALPLIRNGSRPISAASAPSKSACCSHRPFAVPRHQLPPTRILLLLGLLHMALARVEPAKSWHCWRRW